MTVIDDFLASLEGDTKQIVSHMYDVTRRLVPDATEEISYGMPAFKWNGKGLLAIMPTKAGFSLYPFCSIARLDIDLSEYEQTTGSLHFSAAQPISDTMLRTIIEARQKQILS